MIREVLREVFIKTSQFLYLSSKKVRVSGPLPSSDEENQVMGWADIPLSSKTTYGSNLLNRPCSKRGGAVLKLMFLAVLQ